MSRLVGRDAEVRELAAFVSAFARRVGASALALSGDAGVGKSRLLAEALHQAGTHPGRDRVVRVTGYEPELPVPLSSAQPLFNAFLPGGEPRPADRLALFEAAHGGVRSARAPVLIVVDDLQWVDDHSLALLHYLARGASAEQLPLGLLIATRPAPRAAAFLEAMGRVLADGFRATELTPLRQRDAEELARRLGAGSSAEEVSRRAAGSPFWIEVLAREVAGRPARGPRGRAAGAAAGTGRDGRRAVSARVAGVSADAAEFLALLTVAAHPVAASEAARILGWPTGRIDAALAELVTIGIARSGMAGAALVHDLVREALAAEVGEGTRIRFHRLLAEHLERGADGDARRLWEALEHRAAAGDDVTGLAGQVLRAPNRRLVGTTVLAALAEIAEGVGAPDVPASSSTDGGARGGLDEAVAALATDLAAHELAITTWTRIAERSHDPATVARAALAGVREAIALNDGPRARRLLAAARDATATAPETRLAIIADALEAGVVRWIEGDLVGAREPANRALEAARRRWPVDGPRDEDDRAAYLEAIQAASDAAMGGMHRAEMLALAHEMRAVAADAPEVEVRLGAWWQSGVAENMSGLLRDAESSLRRVWDEAGRRLLPRLRADAGYWLGYALVDLGRAAEAQAVLRETAALLDRTGGNLRFNNPIVVPLGIAAIVAGDWRGGIGILESGAAATDDVHVRMRITAQLADWRARLGGADEAQAVREIVDVTLRDAYAVACPRCLQEAEVICADAAATVGDADRAAEALARWRGRRLLEANAYEHLHAARAAARLGEDAAVSRLRVATDAAIEAGQILEGAWSLVVLADLASGRDPDGARAAIRRAAELASDAGMVTMEAIAARRARSLGLRTWRRRMTNAPMGRDGSALTTREREVARHIAAGESNAEIAAALFLSPRTVDRHVENILRKLAVPNRAAAVAALGMGSPADDQEPDRPIASR